MDRTKFDFTSAASVGCVRALIAFVFSAVMLSWSAPASSSPLKLRLDVDVVSDAISLVSALRAPAIRLSANANVLPLLQSLPTSAAAKHPSVPAHYAWVERDTRSFWYSAGAGAVTTLGTHILVGLPTLFVSANIVGPMMTEGSPAALVVGLGIFTAYTLVESGLSSLVAMLVFDSMSDTYQSRYLTGFLGHFGGAVLSTTVTTLTFGLGLLVLHGSSVLSDFTGNAGFAALSIFSVLGAMPAVVIAGTALVAVPALTTSWALSAGAVARPGYEIDERWRIPTLSERTEDPTRQRHRESDRVATIGIPIALP